MIRYTVKKNAYYQGFMSSETPKILTKEAVVNCSKIIWHDFVFNSGMIPEVFHVFFLELRIHLYTNGDYWM